MSRISEVVENPQPRDGRSATGNGRRARRRRPQAKTGLIATLVAVAVSLAAWYFVGPAQLGGQNTYVITSGISMNPLIYQGDFVVVRRDPAYHVGDVVAYHLEHSLILHRIIREEGGRFVMKGDNNPSPDSTRPAPSDIAGKMWVHIPSGGAVLTWLKQPGVLLGLALVWLLATRLRKRGQPRSRRSERTMETNGSCSQPGHGTINLDALLLAAAAAVVAAALAVISFARPLQHTVQAPAPYRQAGTFSYSGIADGGVYDGGKVSGGDQVYFKLVRGLNLGFDYRFSSAAPHQIRGSYALQVDMGQADGGSWKRSALLVPETPFQGDRASFGGYLDLYAVQALMNNFAAETGVRGSEFTLTVTPIVKARGSVAGSPLTQQFAPPMVFKVSAEEMRLDQPLDKADPLQPSQTGQVTRPVLTANVLPLPLGINLPVLETRLLSLVALVVALSATAMFGLPVLAARRGDEPARISARYGGMLLDVHGAADAIPEQRMVDVRRPDDLAKIAEREGRMILHSNGSDVHQYLVSDGEIVYRYLAHAGTGAKREG